MRTKQLSDNSYFYGNNCASLQTTMLEKYIIHKNLEIISVVHFLSPV